MIELLEIMLTGLCVLVVLGIVCLITAGLCLAVASRPVVIAPTLILIACYVFGRIVRQ